VRRAPGVHSHLAEDPNFAISTEGYNLLAVPATPTRQRAQEAATFQAFCEQASALAVMLDHLQQVAATATEAKQMTTQRVVLQNSWTVCWRTYRGTAGAAAPIDWGRS